MTREVAIDLYSVIKQKYIEREVLDKIRAEIEERPYGIANDSIIQGMKYERTATLAILDKYMAESEE